MKPRLIFVPLAAVAVAGAYVSFHPGVASAEPRSAFWPRAEFGQEASYTIDLNHSGVYFEVRHLGLATVTGRFNKFSGKVYEDAKDLTKSRFDFKAEVASVDTGIAARDEHLRTADFFDVEKFPALTFKSTKVEKKGDKYVVTGDLTIKDKTRRVSIPFKHYGPVTFNFGEPSTHIGVVADPIVIKRSEFSVGDTAPLPDGTMGVSDEVTVRISFEAIKDK